MNNEPRVKIGITGQAGFVGTYLYNELGLEPKKYKRIHFEDYYFTHYDMLRAFVRQCDVIIHLAAVNRHSDLNELYKTNVELVTLLIEALEQENVRPHIIFSSSIQEGLDNPYGKSKLEGRKLFEKWAQEKHASFTGMIVPNIFGPFGFPNYNSFVATFCYKLTHNEVPEVIVDNEVSLIYVGSFCKQILSDIDGMNKFDSSSIIKKQIMPDFTKKVSEILRLLYIFKEQYFKCGIIPAVMNDNELNLFNTFRSYIDIDKYFPFLLRRNMDERGAFVETIRLEMGGQVSFSTTNLGVTRGNHYHTRKIERLIVIKGKAKVQLRKVGSEQIHELYLDGQNPSYVDIPVWFSHNITNIGDEELYTQFWINEWYNEANPDTFFEKV